jgi:predicted nucleic acid-binding protein
VRRYLDTSALVSILVDEARSQSAREWWERVSGENVIGAFAAMKIAAVVSRRVRTGVSSDDEAREVLRDFDLLRDACGSHVHCREDFDLAEKLIRDFPTKLAAPDALHLASVINLDATLVTFDERLAEAARMRGASVAAPS